jgi:uncharacterized protein YbcI
MTDPAALRSPSGANRNGQEVVEPATHVGGELNAAVTSPLVGIQTHDLGRGPRRASTFYHGNVLVTLLNEVLTRAEQSLVDANQDEAVRSVRRLLDKTMAADFCAAVGAAHRPQGAALISGNHPDPDIAAEVFVLDGPVTPFPPPRGTTDARSFPKT